MFSWAVTHVPAFLAGRFYCYMREEIANGNEQLAKIYARWLCREVRYSTIGCLEHRYFEEEDENADPCA